MKRTMNAVEHLVEVVASLNVNDDARARLNVAQKMSVDAAQRYLVASFGVKEACHACGATQCVTSERGFRCLECGREHATKEV